MEYSASSNSLSLRDKKKTRTFSGCWTCRSRRIKCDERRPVCGRCARSRVNCEGYGVRLLWKNALEDGATSTENPIVRSPPQTYSSVSRRRSSNESADDCWRPARDSDLHHFLDECNSVFGGRTTHRHQHTACSTPNSTQPLRSESAPGPNGDANAVEALSQLVSSGAAHLDQMLHSNNKVPLPSLLQPPDPRLNNGNAGADVITAAGVPFSVANCTNQRSDKRRAVDSDSGLGSEHWSFTEGELDEQLADVSGQDLPISLSRSGLNIPKQIWSEQRPSNAVHDVPTIRAVPSLRGSGSCGSISYSPDTGQLPPTKTLLGHGTTIDVAHDDGPDDDNEEPTRHIDELSVPSRQKDLIHHWVSFLCKNMVPVDLVDNPYRVVYLPFAFEGIDLPVTQSSSNLALFHSLCAVSAENQLYLGISGTGVTKLLAARHNSLALHHLQLAITVQPPRDNTASILSAILICILRDTVTGEARNWRGHIQGALSYLPEPHAIEEVRPGSSFHIVLEQFLCLAIFGNVTTAYNLYALINKLPDSLSYIRQYHGIDKFILRAILSVNQYAAGQNQDHVLNVSQNTSSSSETPCSTNSDRRHKPPNPVSLQDMERLELQAYLHAPPPIPPGTYLRPEDASVAMHYAHVYYYTLLIYLKRSIHHASPMDLSELVERGLSHLELAEEISGGSNGCIFLWPCLVIGAECSSSFMKARALAWFKLKRRHGFRSVDLGPEILVKYWEWRDKHPDQAMHVTWQQFTRGTEEDVVPI